MNRVSTRLAARLGTQQLDGLHAANAAADRADAAVARGWRKLLRLLTRKDAAAWNVYHDAAAIVRQMYADAHATIRGDLTKLAKWGHDSTAAAIVGTLPVGYLRRAANATGNLRGPNRNPFRVGTGRSLSQESRASRLEQRPLLLPARVSAAGAVGSQCGGQHQGSAYRTDHHSLLESPGFVTLTADPFAVTNELEPVLDLPADEQRDMLRDLLFPPPTADHIARILRVPIAGSSWEQDLSQATSLANPHKIASVLAGAFAAGMNPREAAKTLLPHVQGVQTTARRVARTYGVMVANRASMDSHEALGDLCVGFMIHATLDQHTRSWHAKRSGTVYYKRPGPGQKGPAQQPHPPLEAEDPAERPPGTPRTAWHCRCWLSPVLRGDDEIERHPEFANVDSAVIPDPLHYDSWFRRADDQRRRLAVGARRFAVVKDQLGGATPEWGHFLDPDTGSLLPLDHLKTESDVARAERTAKVRAAIAHEGQQRRDVANYGFLPGTAPAPPKKPPPRAGLLPGGQVVRYERHERARRDEVLVMVDPRRLDDAWRQDTSYYLPVGGIGVSGVAGRREAFAQFLDTGERVQAPRIAVGDDGIPAFTDGRHRFAVLRDRGVSAVGIMVPKEQAADVRRRFGLQSPAGFLVGAG